MIKLIKNKELDMYIKILIIILLVIFIINNILSKENFQDLTDEEKEEKEMLEKIAKVAKRDFNSEKVEYYKTPYMCLDYADMMLYE